MEEKKEVNDFKKKHFAKLHEKIQSKYDEMQKKLEKSKSVDTLATLKDDYNYKEQRYSSNDNLRESDEYDSVEIDRHSLSRTVIVEEVATRNARFHDVHRAESISESIDDFMIIEREEIEQENNEYNKLFNYSLESIPCTPPPKISIRDRISSKILARRERRKAEKENAMKDSKKKETREKVEKFILSNTTKQDVVKAFKKSKLATLTIALIEASGLETDVSEEKPRFMVCRFRLGAEKYKSKLIKSHNPVVKWQELFNFNMYDENMLEITLWDKDIFIGRTTIDLLEIEKEKTHRMRLDLECETGNAEVFILLTITGIALANTLVDLDDYNETQRRLSALWYHIKNKAGDVGCCSIIVYGAKGLSEVTVHDEKKSEDVGKVSIPLLNINNDEKQWYALKDSTQRERAKGNNPRILLEMKITWSPLRASMRVINPKEEKYLELDDKLQRHIFARNLSRAKAVFSWIMDAFRIVKTLFEWESRKSNVIALLTWLLFCWFFKMWMLPLLLLIPFVWYRPENTIPQLPSHNNDLSGSFSHVPRIHKFTRKIIRPNRIPNNEILDLLSRVPDDETLVSCQINQ
ncbi:Multiple C2 and transmembrane domain-containing protein 1 [Operophtera brumata]|uniref:Multiple C2 and transmembrane domain-containing protein 1 n=1 Tax=Operophtera brumata TaxID=104452 RepID=A0A0L7LFK5_OPEBR|nr:Multiple C2 and transmembrane domain-containing protein 1 [Operophtera brumata]